jgi:hypothetical protein
MDTSMPLASPNTAKKGQALDSKNLQQTDEILNSILPPRYGLSYKIIIKKNSIQKLKYVSQRVD